VAALAERLDIVIGGYLETSPQNKCFWWEGEWYNQAFLKNMTDICEGTLRAAGFSEGQRIAALMPNSPMMDALALAVWRLGGAICPLNVKSGLSSLISTLSLLDPFAVVLSDEVQKEIVSELDAREWVHVTCSSMGPLPEFRGRTGSVESSEVAVIFSTSGTTGTPKAVPISHTNLLDNCRQCIESLEDLKEGDVLLNVLPNFHAFGFMAGSILPLVLKGAQAIVPSFLPPPRTLKAIGAAPVNVVLLVPMMLNFL
jgi:long-chain acyl-CoA synthetase